MNTSSGVGTEFATRLYDKLAGMHAGKNLFLSPFSIRPVSGALGAEISGINIADDLPQPVIDELLQALLNEGLILGATYMLWLYRSVVFGVLDKDDVKTLGDLSWREIVMFVPMIVLVFWMGIYPSTFMKPMAASVQQVVSRFNPDLTP